LRLKGCHFAVATTRNYTGFIGIPAKMVDFGARLADDPRYLIVTKSNINGQTNRLKRRLTIY
jgi:hypothetical protein